jgi:excinuclease ABC subunit C
LEQLAERFDLPEAPSRIEVYDNSHIQGSNAIGAFIVAGSEGFDRRSYRTFNIKGEDKGPGAKAAAAGGDDYAMMREVLRRRFSRLVKEDPERAGGGWPDLVVIDGGAGQLGAATEVMAELDLADLPLMAVAKGPQRDAGQERFFLPGREQPLALDAKDPVLYFVQRLRDEAHRFAIQTHRGKRARDIGRSRLDEVPGVGAKRKRALLNHFGSARGVAEAGLLDLERVPGIDRAVARTIYDFFHDGR